MLVMVVLVFATNGQAFAADTSADVQRAEAIMKTGYENFASLPHERPFDWSTDGCSVPYEWIPERGVFEDACRLHDFGYRNFGSQGLGLQPTESARKMIDNRFLTEMKRICAKRFPMSANPFGPSRYEWCGTTAVSYFQAVRDHGAQYFF